MISRKNILFSGFLCVALVFGAGCVSVRTQEEVAVGDLAQPDREGVYHKVREGEIDMERIDLDENDRLVSLLPLSHSLERMAGHYTPFCMGCQI